MMRSTFDGTVVVITGGGGGIGKAAAARFLEEGASVVLAGRRRDVLEAAREELEGGERVELVAADLARSDAAGRLVETAVSRFGRLDVLVNSTGVFRPVPFLEQTVEEVEEALDSILRPTFYPSQAAARAMVARGTGGAIVSVGSMWALDAITTTPTSAYSAAQAGRHALTKNLAIELAPHGIRVNTVALAFVETPAYERFLTPEQAREVLDSVAAFHPLGRHGLPADVVEAVLFYASPASGWITGTTMPIDGGVLAGRNAPPQAVAVAA
ncbi:MAG TPA: SDR family NAD(P)-dependent oxidoreductase [Gaiella sp.]|nr:SDR family NAD(P)-dependent oxidoreductase [Gaiella sp.]